MILMSQLNFQKAKKTLKKKQVFNLKEANTRKQVKHKDCLVSYRFQLQERH